MIKILLMALIGLFAFMAGYFHGRSREIDKQIERDMKRLKDILANETKGIKYN